MREFLKFPLLPAVLGFACAAACSQELNRPFVTGSAASGGASALPVESGSTTGGVLTSGTGGTSNPAVASGGAPASGGGATVPSAAGGSAGTLAGLPCEVATLVASKCAACHSGNLPNVPKLLTPADFQLPAKLGGTLAQASLTQMASGAMPPAPPGATPAEQKGFSDWVSAGAMPTTCGAPPPVLPPDPYATPVTCTSMKTWMNANKGSELMRPGAPCIACHSMDREAPLFSLSGTVYPSAHEPDDCNGSKAESATVIIKDADGVDYTLQVNAAGNFFSLDNIPLPYTARVESNGKVRAMVAPQTDGDCNGCHTESGANGAPGRIMAP